MMARLLPIAGWLPHYKASQFTQDALAGVTVGVMLIPQSMAYSILAGLPPIYGLYASTVPLFVYAMFASSTQLQVGVVATTGILLQSSVQAMNPSDDAEYIRFALALTCVAGFVQLALGLMRFGFIANLLSWPVMSGFTSAAAFIILGSQLQSLLGLPSPPPGTSTSFFGRVGYAMSNAGATHAGTFMFSLLCLGVLMGAKQGLPNGRRIPKWFPVQLVVVVAAIVLSYCLDFPASGINVLGPVPAGLPTTVWPLESVSQVIEMLPAAFTLSVVSYVGAISLAIVFAAEVKQTVDANMELVALGMSCIVGSFFQSHVVSGSFTRTAINNEMGSTSPMSVVVTGLLMMLSLLVLSPVFEYLPKSVLAAMIVSSLKSLIKVSDAKTFWACSKIDFAQMAVSFVAVLSLGLDVGIMVATAFSLGVVLCRSFRPKLVEMGVDVQSRSVVELASAPTVHRSPGIVVVVRASGELHFGNCKDVCGSVMASIKAGGLPAAAAAATTTKAASPAASVLARAAVHAVVLDMSKVTAVDASACKAILDVRRQCQEAGVLLVFAECDTGVSELLTSFGVISPLSGRDVPTDAGRCPAFESVRTALASLPVP